MRPDNNSGCSQKGREARMKTSMPNEDLALPYREMNRKNKTEGRDKCFWNPEPRWTVKPWYLKRSLWRPLGRSRATSQSKCAGLGCWPSTQVTGGTLQESFIFHNGQRNRSRVASPINTLQVGIGTLEILKHPVSVTKEENIASSLTEQAISECTLKSKPFCELELREQ